MRQVFRLGLCMALGSATALLPCVAQDFTPGVQPSPQPFGGSQSSSQPFGGSQSSAQPFGAPQSSSQPFGGSQPSAQPFGASQPSSQPFGAPQSSAQPFGAPQSSSQPFGASQSSAQPWAAPSTGSLLPNGRGNPNQRSAPASSPWHYLNDARTEIQKGDPARALELTQQFIRIRPLEPEGYFWQGVCYDNLAHPETAVQSYEYGLAQTLSAGMDSAEMRLNDANDLLKLGRTDDAIAQYKRASEIDSGLPVVYLNLGRALTEKGDTAGALAAFQRCEELHFEPNQLAYYRAKTLMKAGRTADARMQVESAIAKLNPGNSLAERLKQEFADVLK